MQRWIVGILVAAGVIIGVLAVVRSHSNSFVGKWRPVKMTVNGQPVSINTQPNVTVIEIKKYKDGYVVVSKSPMDGYGMSERNGYLTAGMFADGPQGGFEHVLEYSIDENTHRLIRNERQTSSMVGMGTKTSTTRIEYVRVGWLFE